MKKIIATIFLLAVTAQVLAAAPSDASLNELMTITNIKSVLDGTYAQMDQMMDGMVQQSLKGQKVTKAQEKANKTLPRPKGRGIQNSPG
jgi:hypothetical protein